MAPVSAVRDLITGMVKHYQANDTRLWSNQSHLDNVIPLDSLSLMAVRYAFRYLNISND